MKKILSFILTPLFYLVFGLILVVFHVYQVIALRLFGHNAHDRSVAILNLFLMRSQFILGATFKFNNFKELPTDKPIIIIANHQSMWDIPPLIWKFRKHHPKFIAKKELTKGIPSISYNLKYGGSVNIDRKKPAESVKKITEFAKYIKEKNYAICVFPEGTRSKDGKVKSFKVGGVAALLNEIPDALVVPVAINGTGKIDNTGSFLLNLGVKVIYTQLPERYLTLENIETELNQIRKEIIDLVEE
jgi:1-acyl-sn-glycerol-3-phosphate acyltransferase